MFGSNERGNIMVTSNRSVGEWGEVFGPVTAATGPELLVVRGGQALSGRKVLARFGDPP